jgi:hypothetical protein
MAALDMAAGRLAKVADELAAEQQRPGGPQSRQVRLIGDDLFTVAGDLIAAAYEIDALANGS